MLNGEEKSHTYSTSNSAPNRSSHDVSHPISPGMHIALRASLSRSAIVTHTKCPSTPSYHKSRQAPCRLHIHSCTRKGREAGASHRFPALANNRNITCQMRGGGRHETGLRSRDFAGRSADATRMRVARRVQWLIWKGEVGVRVQRRYKGGEAKGSCAGAVCNISIRLMGDIRPLRTEQAK